MNYSKVCTLLYVVWYILYTPAFFTHSLLKVDSEVEYPVTNAWTVKKGGGSILQGISAAKKKSKSKGMAFVDTALALLCLCNSDKKLSLKV